MANMSGFGAAAYGRQDSKDDDRHANDSFRTFLAKHRLRRLKGSTEAGFTVESESGSTYRVRIEDTIVGGGYLRWRWACDCKARGRCRHIEACEHVAFCEALSAGDRETLEAMERVAD